MSTSDSHDTYFRFVMQYLVAAQQFLEWFAPDFILDSIDLDSLTFVDASYVNKSLSKTFSDVVFDCRYKAIDDNNQSKWQAGKIVILIEHQSTPEKLLPIRVYNYIFNLLEKMRKNNKKKDANKPLPVVYPMIYYNGKRKSYPFSTNVQTCISGPPQTLAYYPNKDIQLININELPTQETAKHQIAGIMAEAMKQTTIKSTPANFVSVLTQIAQFANSLPEGFTKTTINYMINVKSIDNIEQLVEQAEQNQQLPEQVRGEVMTIAEALIAKGVIKGEAQGIIKGEAQGIIKGEAQGIIKGEAQGIIKGEAQGKIEGKSEVALNMLRQGISVSDVAKFTGFDISRINELSKQLLN